MEKERKQINVIKGALIILVVIGHFGQSLANALPSNIAFIEQGLMLFIYSFHMPLFMFVSGYLSTNDEKRRKKAFEDLFIPFLLFQIFVGICYAVLSKSNEVFYNIFVPQMGAWYLMALFIFRLLLPDLKRIRYILITSVAISVFAFLFKNIGNEFAMTRVLGFFVYFYFGYFAKKSKLNAGILNKMNKNVARIILILIIFGFVVFVREFDVYSDGISVLTRSMPKGYGFMKGLLINSVVLLLAFIFGCLFLIALPKEHKLLEFIGKDTMPLYLSHLIVFMAFGYLKSHFSWIVTSVMAMILIILSIAIFSTSIYRNLFNNSIKFISKKIFVEEE